MDITELAELSLRANIENLGSRRLLTAGRNHFRTLWTRDFCMSVAGLIKIGEIETAVSHHQFLLDGARNDGLIPRVYDSMSTRVRVALSCAAGLNFKLREPLRPEFVDEHGTEALDSNALVVIAADLIDTLRPGYWKENEIKLQRAIGFYVARAPEGRLFQNAFSDWQDSAARVGFSSYLHLLIWRVAEIAQTRGIDVEGLDKAVRDVLQRELFDPTTFLFRSLRGRAQWNADATLLALLWDFFDRENAERVYQALRSSRLWRQSPLGLPGKTTYPDYLSNEKSLAVRLACTEGYHDRFYWSWLIGLAVQVCTKMGDLDEAKRVRSAIEAMHHSSHGIEEVFGINGQPVKTWAYRSECPFSWGAAWLVG